MRNVEIICQMSSLPHYLSMNSAFGVGGATALSHSSVANSQSSAGNRDRNMASSEQLVLELSTPELRENALLELSKVSSLLPFSRKSPFRCLFLVSISD